MRKNKRRFLLSLLLFAALGAGVLLVLKNKSNNFEINGEQQAENEKSAAQVALSAATNPAQNYGQSSISGLACADAERRPFAVMLAEDAAARPLSGLSDADMVFEMPVVDGGVNRLMAVFVCGNPKEIGSARSARHDFISLARGLGAIFAHWGGSHFALDKLNTGIMDNIDALPNPFDAFWRKSGKPAPHNGFTSIARLTKAAQKLGYSLKNEFSGYPHLSDEEAVRQGGKIVKTLTIGYPGDSAVKYRYDPASNSYLRWRAGRKEVDANNGRQAAAKNVVIMRAVSRELEGQYNDVDVEGSGKAVVYRNGEEIFGTWKKDAADQNSKLYFYDSVGQEVKFALGAIWVEVADPGLLTSWQ